MATTIESSVTDRLRALILAGELPAGHHMQEVPLASSLGVSRTPVRAALAALGQEGLLVGRPKRGYVVREFSTKEIMDAYAVRGRLEALACGILATEGVAEPVRRALGECVAAGEEVLAVGRLTDEGAALWRENNDRYHRVIMEATGNAALIDAIVRTSSLPLVSSRAVQWTDYEEIRVSQHHHAVIAEAILGRQPARAEAMMVEHVFVAAKRFRRNLDRIAPAGSAAPRPTRARPKLAHG